MITQTLAIFKDAYRELNAKKLFWVALMISLAVVVSLGLPANNDRGLSMFGATVDIPMLSTKAVSHKGFYKFLFSWFGVGLWLTWGATVLALLSTASMVPDLISGGAVELVLSKPIGRLRVFLTKYAAGLLFVALQAAVFAVGSVVVVGVRAGSWEVRPLLAIPLAVLFFSYLFSICVLIGMVTRSTLMALLFTMIAWIGIWAMTTVENVLLDQRLQREREVARLETQLGTLRQAVATIDEQIKQVKERTPAEGAGAPESVDSGGASEPSVASGASPPPDQTEPPRRPGGRRVRNLLNIGQRMLAIATLPTDVPSLERRRSEFQTQTDQLERELPETRQTMQTIQKWHRWIYGAMAVLPKTGETKRLFQRYVVDKDDLEGFLKILAQQTGDSNSRDVEDALNSRSLWWVTGTSLLFETVMVGLAAGIFCRRDF